MKKIKTIFLLILLMLLVLPFNIHAEEGKITFSINGAPNSAKIGDKITLTVKEEGANDGQLTLSGYNLTLKYDASILEVAGASGEIGISGSNTITDNQDLKSIEFTVKAVPKDGKSNITLEINDCSVNGESANNKCSKNGTTIKIRELSSDATLSGLSIPNTTLSPAFNKNTHDYTAEVTDITQLDVKATASDANATVQISDNYKNLQKGENEIKIVVTAENGKKNTYIIKVNALFAPTEEELRLTNTNLSTLEIKGQKLDFTKEEVKYYINVPYSVTSLEITATPENAAAQVQISGEDKLIVGKNTVNILVTAEDGTTTKTYSIVVTRLQQNKKIVKTCPDTTSVKEWIIFSVGLFLTFTLGIVLGYILGKKNILGKIFKKKEKQDESVEIQTLSDTIDLSDVVEELKEDDDVKKA